MKYIIIAFRSRNTLQKFIHLLKQNNVVCKIINTPSALSSSCGLSAKTDYSNYGIINSILNQIRFDDFMGVYLVNNSKSFNQFQRLL